MLEFALFGSAVLLLGATAVLYRRIRKQQWDARGSRLFLAHIDETRVETERLSGLNSAAAQPAVLKVVPRD